ncbi:MAG: FHA domain-containing protein [Butyrivibrio sp.]|nr:FHA domain-containing protein [Butyrivibrio sp.]
MNIQYDRDGSHNYLVLDAEGMDLGKYEYMMLESNHIEGIIPFGVRRVDGHPFFYYEIDSKQSLNNRYGHGKLSYEKLRSLVKALVGVSERLSGYFLDDEKIVMESQCIFESNSSGDFYFLYLPEYEETIEFGEMIMDLVNTDDEKAVEFAYKITEAILDGNGNYSTALGSILFDDNDEPREYCECVEPHVIGEYEAYGDEEDDKDGEVVERRVVKIRIPSKVSILLSILFALVAGALWYIRVMYILTLEENILDISILMLCVMMSLISLLQSGLGGKLKRKKDEGYVDDEDAEDDEEDYEKDYVINTPVVAESYQEVEEDCEETVFLGSESNVTLRKLYSINKGCSQNISLDKLPITIGKSPDMADVVIKDPTVSRIHARIMLESGEAFLQDLNSKNGCFINGKRLLPNEKAVIIPDDEIAFGQCLFIYR